MRKFKNILESEESKWMIITRERSRTKSEKKFYSNFEKDVSQEIIIRELW